MNKVLTEQIIKHIFYNLAILSSSTINLDKTKSLMSKDFLILEKVPFETNIPNINNNIWACQVYTDKHEIKFLLGDCRQEKNVSEFCLLVELKDAPIYGLYLVENKDNISSDPLIACSMDGIDWMECKTFLQATFLAGMEQIRELGLTWKKCPDYQAQYNSMITFIKFYNAIYERPNEG